MEIQIAAPPVKVNVRVQLRDKVETFAHPVTGYDDATIQRVVEHFEGHVGTVFSIRTMGGDSLYYGLVEEGEI